MFKHYVAFGVNVPGSLNEFDVPGFQSNVISTFGLTAGSVDVTLTSGSVVATVNITTIGTVKRDAVMARANELASNNTLAQIEFGLTTITSMTRPITSTSFVPMPPYPPPAPMPPPSVSTEDTITIIALTVVIIIVVLTIVFCVRAINSRNTLSKLTTEVEEIEMKQENVKKELSTTNKIQPINESIESVERNAEQQPRLEAKRSFISRTPLRSLPPEESPQLTPESKESPKKKTSMFSLISGAVDLASGTLDFIKGEPNESPPPEKRKEYEEKNEIASRKLQLTKLQYNAMRR